MRLTDPAAGLRLALALAVILGAAQPGAAREPEIPGRIEDQSVLGSGPEPLWALPAWPEDEPFPATVEGSGGLEFILVSEQQNPATAEAFSRYIVRARNPSGVQAGSQIEIKFDPEFQKLTVNRLDLIRDGRRISRLGTARWRVIQNEDSLSDNIFAGDRTAICFIEDVRPGDVIDYSYTLAGQNPVFGGLWFEFLPLGWDEPVGRLLYRVIVPPGREIARKILGRAPPLTFTEKPLPDGSKELRWESGGFPANICEGDEPDWHHCVPVLQLSEMRSWADLAVWGSRLYTANAPDPALDALARELAARASKDGGAGDPGAVAGEIIRFVQDEVRYQAFHQGIFAFQPASPAEAAAARYGDCKDKSRLLIDLLARAGIQAHAALVASGMGPALDGFLPSPIAFDHVIVRIDDPALGAAWVDATISGQGGRWNERALGVSGFALELRPGVTGLSAIKEPESAFPRRVVSQTIVSGPVGRPARMETRAEFFGSEAESARSRLEESGAAAFGRSLLRDLWETHPQALADGPLESEDDREANRVTIKTAWRLPDFWEESEDGKSSVANLHADEIADTLPTVSVLQRSAPLALGGPREVRHTILVKLPERWDVEESNLAVLLPELEYRSSAKGGGRTVTLDYRIKFLTDHAAPERAGEIARALRTIRNDLGFQITKTHPPLENALRKAFRTLAEAAEPSAAEQEDAAEAAEK